VQIPKHKRSQLFWGSDSFELIFESKELISRSLFANPLGRREGVGGPDRLTLTVRDRGLRTTPRNRGSFTESSNPQTNRYPWNNRNDAANFSGSNNRISFPR
jgi:hypothetical protein